MVLFRVRSCVARSKFELPGAKKTSKKPFRLVNYEVLVGEHVKSFGLAAFLDDNPRPNQDFWRSQSAFPRFLRVQMGPKSNNQWRGGWRQAAGGWEPGGGDLGEFTCGKRWGFLSVLALATTDAEPQVASLTAPLLSLKGSVAGSRGYALLPPTPSRTKA